MRRKIIGWFEYTLYGQLKKTHIHSDLSLSFYDINTNEFKKEFQGYHFSKLPSFISYKKKLLSDGKKLIKKINSLKMDPFKVYVYSPIYNPKLTDLSEEDFMKIYKPQKAELSDEEQKEYRNLVNENWGNIIDESFFYLGSLLKKSKAIFPYSEVEYEGTEPEKEKNSLIQKFLSNYIMPLKTLDILSYSLEKALFLPICIRNTTAITDSNITINITSNSDSYTLFNFDKHIEDKSKEFLDSLADCILENKFPKKILSQNANIDVNTGSFESVKFNMAYMPDAFGKTPAKDLNDLKKELSSYQVDESSSGLISYDLQSIRSSESIWLEPWMIIVPKFDKFTIHYSIISDKLGARVKGSITRIES